LVALEITDALQFDSIDVSKKLSLGTMLKEVIRRRLLKATVITLRFTALQ
jgi:hypothetical protein